MKRFLESLPILKQSKFLKFSQRVRAFPHRFSKFTAIKQIELVARMMEMARAAQEQADGSNAPIDVQSIPDEIVVQVFSDPRAEKVSCARS